MSLRRIYAVLLQEYYVTYRSIEVIFDVFIYSVIQLLLFGFLSLYLAGTRDDHTAEYLLLGMLLWEIVRVIQYSISVGSLWNIWSRNLSNMFLSPLTISEYLTAHTLSGIAKASIVFLMNATVTWYVFGYTIFSLGWMLGVYIFVLSCFAFAVGLFILGAIFRYGTRIQAFAWGFLPMLQPLTATFFPVDILPTPLQYLSWLFPSTYVFEASRYQVRTGLIDWWSIIVGMSINIVYIILSLLFFSYMFSLSKNSGQFSRNES